MHPGLQEQGWFEPKVERIQQRRIFHGHQADLLVIDSENYLPEFLIKLLIHGAVPTQLFRTGTELTLYSDQWAMFQLEGDLAEQVRRGAVSAAGSHEKARS